MTWDIAEVYFITFVLARVGITIPILLFYPGLPLESIDGSAPASSRMVPMGWCRMADLFAEVPRLQLLLRHGGLRCSLDSGAGSHVSWPRTVATELEDFRRCLYGETVKANQLRDACQPVL